LIRAKTKNGIVEVDGKSSENQSINHYSFITASQNAGQQLEAKGNTVRKKKAGLKISQRTEPMFLYRI